MQIATLVLGDSFIFFSENDNGTYLRSCDISNSNSACGKNQRCRMINNNSICDCVRGYHLVNGECVMTTSTAIAESTTLKPEYRPESGGGMCTLKRNAFLFFDANEYFEYRLIRTLLLCIVILNIASPSRWTL